MLYFARCGLQSENASKKCHKNHFVAPNHAFRLEVNFCNIYTSKIIHNTNNIEKRIDKVV